MISQEQFIAAAQNGRTDTISDYLSRPGADIECRGYLNMTALLLATRNGHLDSVRYLIKKGADIHNAWYPETASGTALEMAAEIGHSDIFTELLAAGSQVNNPFTGKSPALIAAAMGGHLEVVKHLIDAGANVKSTTGDQTTTLILISGFGPNHAKNPDPGLLRECMQKIMDAGVDVNTVDNLNQTALSRAVNANNEAIVKFLLDAGADPDRAASVLPVSQLIRHKNCLKLLTDHGLPPRFFENAITTALLNGQPDNGLVLAAALPGDLNNFHTRGIRFVRGCLTNDSETFSTHVNKYAASQIMAFYGGIALSVLLIRGRQRTEKIRILLDAGADVNTDLGYQSPILLAARSGDVELLQLLMDHGAAPDPISGDFPTPLMIVAGFERLYDDRTGPARSFDEPVDRKIRLLIDAGADVNARGPEDLTPLMIAIQRYPFNIEPLLQAGADVNCLSKSGWSPLMAASPKITRRLIDAGADVNIKNKDGRTALFLCTQPAKAEALRKAGADPTLVDQSGMTPLMYHASKGSLKMVKWFARYKKNIRAVDNHGNNAIMHAWGRECVEIIHFLIDRGEDVTIVNHNGDTLLIRGCRMNNMEVIRLALASGIDINTVNAKSETALLIACRYHDDGTTAKLLISKGADPMFRGPDGKNALETARQWKPPNALPGLERLINETANNV